MSKYKLVTFDVTKTLLKLRSPVGHQYSKIASLYGVDVTDPDRLTASFAINWKQLNGEHPNFGRVTIGWRNWWKEVVRRTFASAGHPLDSDRLRAIASHLIAAYGTDAFWGVISGTHETLAALRKNDQLTVGVVSNFDPQLSAVLRHTGLSQYFHFVVNSYDARCSKPQPGIFRVALLEAKGQNVRQCEALHVGNDVTLDYYGAKSAGWDAVLLASGDAQPDVEDPRFVVGDLRDVTQFIQWP